MAIETSSVTPLIQVFAMQWSLAFRDVNAVYEFLRSRGLEPDAPVVTAYGMRQLYVHDPDNYQLCFEWSVNGN